MADNSDQHNENLVYTNILSSNSSFNEHDMTEENMEQNQEEEKYIKSGKRMRSDTDEEEPEWKLIQRKEKKVKEKDSLEIYISCKDKMPKQFLLAKLLKEEGIKDIIRVKYLNHYKIRIEISDEIYANKLETCKKFIDMGWRFYRAMEVTNSYGVIKNVDIDMTDKEILESIVGPGDTQLVSVSRLKRRNMDKQLSEQSWIPSEAIRLCFKGTNIPPYVLVNDLKIKVDRYVFPVTQCSRCWKFGHTAKICLSKNQVCPKCGKSHPNCETHIYNCVNCNGNHMALVKSCPIYMKEKKIRELMADFNCTYRRAMSMYVFPSTPKQQINALPDQANTFNFTPQLDTIEPVADSTPTFANVVKTGKIRNEETTKYFNYLEKKKACRSTENDVGVLLNSEKTQFASRSSSNVESTGEKRREVNFEELLSRLKKIIFLNNESFQSKCQSIIKCCVQWIILIVVDNVGEWPILQKFINLING
jgi:hypothetical protein